MKRKRFLIASIAGIASLHFPFNLLKVNYNSSPDVFYNSLPLFKLCTQKEIKELGKEYLIKCPEENSVSKLISLVVNNNEMKLQSKGLDNFIIRELIDKNIKNDFSADRIIILSGYIISKTEARQAALFQLHQN